jgi:putative transcriptional regulator
MLHWVKASSNSELLAAVLESLVAIEPSFFTGSVALPCSCTATPKVIGQTSGLRNFASMASKYKTDAMAAIHESVEALRDIGVIDLQTMREFDEACLTPVQVLSPEQIKAIRLRERISQPVFARYLNVSRNLVSDWERGVKRPGGPALRLLSVVERKGLAAIA